MQDIIVCVQGVHVSFFLSFPFAGDGCPAWMKTYCEADFNNGPDHNGLAVGVVPETADGEDADDLDDGDEESEGEDGG